MIEILNREALQRMWHFVRLRKVILDGNMIFLSICVCNKRAKLWICVSVWGCLCFGVLLHVSRVWERSLTCISVWTDPWGVTFSTGGHRAAVWLFDSFSGPAPHLMPHTSSTQSTCFQLTLHWAQIASTKGLFKCYLSIIGRAGLSNGWENKSLENNLKLSGF